MSMTCPAQGELRFEGSVSFAQPHCLYESLESTAPVGLFPTEFDNITMHVRSSPPYAQLLGLTKHKVYDTRHNDLHLPSLPWLPTVSGFSCSPDTLKKD